MKMANIHGNNGANRVGYGSVGLMGTAQDDNIYGYDGYDDLFGDGGNDWLDGGRGRDNMYGGLGDDTYIVDDAGDDVIEYESERAGNGQYGGFDTVKSYANFTLSDYVERLELYGSAAYGAGNSLGNEIVGNAVSNTLSGLDGGDTLWGMDGDDYLYGGSGMDTLWGGYHNDWLYGGTWDDTLWGQYGNDTLDGGAGADVMLGGHNDDVYIVRESGDVVVESVGQGNDTVYSNLGDYTLPANVEGLLLEYGLINGTGNELRNQIVGSDDQNTINGMGGDDTLYGAGGRDTLDGGTGNDEMHGNSGDDTYKVDSAGDSVLEDPDDGTDTVQSTINFTLGANVENLELTGSATTGTGNSLGNKLSGNGQGNTLNGGSGDDRLYGQAGQDTLIGGLGADTLSGGTESDKFIFDSALGAGNIDTILTFSVADDDTIWLDNAVFTALTMNAGVDLGNLIPNEFATGASATDSSDRIIYNPQTGALLYDSDGTGAAAAVQFASMSVGLSLTAADFFVM
jgi:Ca2+-binding RTX toxin-like protein